MGSGKAFCILGGILVLLGTFLSSFFSLGLSHAYYIGFLMNLGSLFTSGNTLIIIVTIVFLIIMLSGIFILIGAKSRAMAIIGSLLAIIMGGYWLLMIYGDYSPDIEAFTFLFLNTALVEGIIPLPISLGAPGLGTWLFAGGGVLGLIGGIMGPDLF